MNDTTEAVEDSNVVTLQDGTVIDFGARDNVRTEIQEVEGVAIFRFRTGEVIHWKMPCLDNVEGLLRTAAIYGLTQRVKNNLSGKDKEALVSVVNTSIEDIDNGVFSSQFNGSSGIQVLTDLQAAFAIVRSSIPEKEVPHWKDVEDPEVIKEVKSFWQDLTASQKGKISSNPSVKIQKAKLQVARYNETDGEETTYLL